MLMKGFYAELYSVITNPNEYESSYISYMYMYVCSNNNPTVITYHHKFCNSTDKNSRCLALNASMITTCNV